MSDLVIRLTRPVRFSTGEVLDKGQCHRAEHYARECLRLVNDGCAVPELVETSAIAPSVGPRALDNDPSHFEGVKKRFKIALMKRAHELHLTSAEPPPTGKSWFDVAAEERWAKIQARREQHRAAEEAAFAELLGWFARSAEQKKAEAARLLAEAEQEVARAARAAELVSFESATRALKIAKDSYVTFVELNDPRAEGARECLAVAEQKFTEAELAKNRYEWRGRMFAASAKIAELKKAHENGHHYFPAARLASLLEIEAAAAATLASDDFAVLESFLSEIATLFELSEPSTVNLRSAIGGPVG